MSIRHKMTLQQIFIANLKKFRKEQGLSQMSLSGMCDTTSNYIGQIEMGRRIPSFEKIEQIAAALGISPSMLFMEETTKYYLQKMPAGVKKELSSRLLALIEADIAESLDIER